MKEMNDRETAGAVARGRTAAAADKQLKQARGPRSGGAEGPVSRGGGPSGKTTQPGAQGGRDRSWRRSILDTINIQFTNRRQSVVYGNAGQLAHSSTVRIIYL